MYQAKRSGSGHAVYKAEHDRSSVRRLTLLGELRRALERDEFVLHYQPIIDARHRRDRAGRGARALAAPRARDASAPSEFIDLAEVSGIIQPLTRWVVRAAPPPAMTWSGRPAHRVGVAVNLSVRNLYDPDLPVHMAEVLAETRSAHRSCSASRSPRAS